MKDSSTVDTGHSEVAEKLDQVAEALAGVMARLDELEGKPAPGVGKKIGVQSKHLAEAALEYIEAHPVRATAIGFLLGAIFFRGRS